MGTTQPRRPAAAAERLLAAVRSDAHLSSLETRHATDRDERLHLRGHDVAMGWILAAMIAFGVAVGLVFPTLVGPLVALRPGEEDAFRLACIFAGFCVGAFAYGVARFTLFRANRRLACLAAYDGLTGLLNQRQFARSLSAQVERARRDGQPTTLIITDLDRFKQINDEHGHTVGDDVLAAVADEVAQSVRRYDIACRIGGEEFAVILPGADKDAGLRIAERVRAGVEAATGAGLPAVTISCGIASYPDDAATARDLTRCADDAMYAAKAAGRNTVRAWER
jgi:diguanylate cyclase (GGDEF)-like protein